MEYYLINVLCNFLLLLVIRRFMGDFLLFDSDNRVKREVYSLCWFVGTIAVNELLHMPAINLIVNILLMILIAKLKKK